MNNAELNRLEIAIRRYGVTPEVISPEELIDLITDLKDCRDTIMTFVEAAGNIGITSRIDLPTN